MAQSTGQRRVQGRVMHEFKHGELKSGPGGKAGKVKSRKQAVAIALKEAGASKYESRRGNARNLRKTERKQAKGQTAQQEREGRDHVGASSRETAARRRGEQTRRELYAKAQRRHIAGRSRMTKQQLKQALGIA